MNKRRRIISVMGGYLVDLDQGGKLLRHRTEPVPMTVQAIDSRPGDGTWPGDGRYRDTPPHVFKVALQDLVSDMGYSAANPVPRHCRRALISHANQLAKTRLTFQ